MTIGQLKHKVEEKVEIPYDDQELLLGLNILENHSSLRDGGVDGGTCVTLLRRDSDPGVPRGCKTQ